MSIALTNTFAVTDRVALEDALAGSGIAVHQRDGALVSLAADQPWTRPVADAVGALLRPGQVAVFMHPASPVSEAYPFMATATHTVEAVDPGL